MTTLNKLVVNILALLLPCATADVLHAQCPGWQGGMGGTNGYLPNAPRTAVEWDPDGTGPQPSRIVTGGSWNYSGRRVLAWDAMSWTSLGEMTSGSSVEALAVYEGSVIAGAASQSSTSADAVYRWNGVDWQQMGSLGGTVRALCVFNGELYASGSFPYILSSVAKWTDSQWLPVGNVAGTSFALAAHDGELITAGIISAAGNPGTYNVLQWDGQSWQSLGEGFDALPRALTVFDGCLVVGGDFQNSAGTPVARVAQWDGSAWAPMGSGFNNGLCLGLAVFSGELFACGTFDSSGTNQLSEVARWNGAEWVGLEGGMSSASSRVSAMLPAHGHLFAFGDFFRAGVNAGPHAARWNGSTWLSVAQGIDAESYPEAGVHALLGFDGELVAAGSFDTYVKSWNGARWRHARRRIDWQLLYHRRPCSGRVPRRTVRRWEHEWRRWRSRRRYRSMGRSCVARTGSRRKWVGLHMFGI
jgi:hypothetical protein